MEKEFGLYSLMLNAQTTKISKRLTHVKPIRDNAIVNCHKVVKVIDLDKFRDRLIDIDCNYIDLFPNQLDE